MKTCKCGSKLDNSAKSCPHCCKRFTSTTTTLIAVLFGVTIFGVMFGAANQPTSTTTPTPTTPEQAAKDAADEAKYKADSERAGVGARMVSAE